MSEEVHLNCTTKGKPFGRASSAESLCDTADANAYFVKITAKPAGEKCAPDSAHYVATVVSDKCEEVECF